MNLPTELIQALSERPVGTRSPGILEQNPILREREIILELADQVNRITREDIDRAERLADVVSWLSELTGDDFCRARALRCVGNIQVIRGNYQQAVLHLQDSLQIFQQLDTEAEQAAGLSSLIQPLIYLGDYDGAFDRAGQAWDIATRRGDELLLARLDINFGNILHRQDRFSDAVASYKAALSTLTRLGQWRDCAVAFLNLAVCYISLNDFNAAEDAYRQARVLSEKENMPTITAQADYNIAYLHYYRSEYSKAIELYQQTRIFCQRSGDSLHSALCDLDQAEMYLDLRFNEEAGELARHAEAAFAQLHLTYEAAKARVWLAVAIYQDGRLVRALELLTESREQMKREGNLAWMAQLDLYQALVLRQEGRYYEALRLCKAAQSAFVAGSSKSVHCNLVRAGLALDLGRADEGLERVVQALGEAEKLQSPHLLFQARRIMAKCQEAQNFPGKALASYQRSLHYLEQIPVNALAADGFKVPYLKDKFEIYEALLSLGISCQPALAPEAVLDIVEKSRSREIADLVSFRANSLRTPSKNRSALVEQLRTLREELNWYYRQTQNAELTDRTEGPVATEMRGLIRSREQSLVETLEAMRETEAEFHTIQAAGTIPIDRARKCLVDDELFLEFFEARGVLYAGLLTHATCQVVPLTRTSVVRWQLRRLNAHFVSMEADNASVPADPGHRSGKTLCILQNLFDSLILPLSEHLGQKRILIARPGPLRYVPFHALFDGAKFLTERHVLSYAGNASLYFIGSTKTPIDSRKDVVVGTQDANFANSLGAGFLNVTDFEELRKHSDLRFVHVDCQLMARLDNPMFSTVIVGKSEKTVLDLFNLELPCSVMSLAGVGAGISPDGDGKEFEGLARALEYAGARTLLLPIWNPRRAPADLFLSSFYKQATVDADVPLAFQQALNAVRKEFPNPYDWAPFVLRGQTGRKRMPL